VIPFSYFCLCNQYKMKDNFERFDMSKPPISTRWYLRPITWIISFPSIIGHRTRIIKEGMDGIKPPFLLLCNHNAFNDFKVATIAMFPHKANYVVAIDGFIGREWLLRNVGCICKRKFTNDVNLIRQLRRTLDRGDIAVIYPEARYSLCGTTAVLPEALGKLCKLLKVPVATLICHGHHANSPFWNLDSRGIKPTKADYKLLFTSEQVAQLSTDELNRGIVDAFQYDDFAWMRENGITTKYDKRAQGLHKVLYQCPACGTEHEMTSEGNYLTCNHCGKSWFVDNSHTLQAQSGETEFSHIPDWYEWERANVRAEIASGRYDSGSLPVLVRSLPNAKKFITLGEGTLRHDMNGFHVRGTDKQGNEFEMEKTVPSLYSCHIEYEYLGKFGDCVDLNTLEDTWYIYPHGCKFSVTKMALATEELYYNYRESIGDPCKKGLA